MGKSGSSVNHKGIWCSAEYGRTVSKKEKRCKNYIKEEKNVRIKNWGTFTPLLCDGR